MVNVLVVDDDKDFLRIVQRVLEAGGYSVVTATDAIGALELIQKEVFDLVLSDANMPGGSGFDLVRTLRKFPSTSNITVALLTGRREKEDVAKGLKCGVDDYIVKPIDPDVFLDKISSLLKNRPPEFRPSVSFAESAVKMEAAWDVKTEITSISERGLTLWSPISAALNSKFKVKSPLFEKIGIEAPTLRVLGCVPDQKTQALYFTEVSFVGLTDSERQKIRFWVNSHLGALKEKKSA